MAQPWICDWPECGAEAVFSHTDMRDGGVVAFCEEHDAAYVCSLAADYGMVFPDVPQENGTPPEREEPIAPVEDHDEATTQTDREAEPTGDALPDVEPEPVTHRPKRGTSRTTE